MISAVINRASPHITFQNVLLSMSLISLVAERAIQWSSDKEMGDAKFASLWLSKGIQSFATHHFMSKCNCNYSRVAVVGVFLSDMSVTYSLFNLKKISITPTKTSSAVLSFFWVTISSLGKIFLAHQTACSIASTFKLEKKATPAIALALCSISFFNSRSDVKNLDHRIETVEKKHKWIKSVMPVIHLAVAVIALGNIVRDIYPMIRRA